MKVTSGEKLTFTCREPAFPRLRLALRTVPVSARIVGDGRVVSASWTGIDMADQRLQAAVALRACNVGLSHGGAGHPSSSGGTRGFPSRWSGSNLPAD